MEEFRELYKMFGCKSVVGIAGAPLGSPWGLFVLVITSYCACSPLHQPVLRRRWVNGCDSTSSGIPSGWRGVPGMLRSSWWRAGQPPRTSHCLRLSVSLSLSVSVTRSLSSCLVSPTFCNWFVDKAGADTRCRGYPLWNRASCGALILNVIYLSSSQSISTLSWSRKRSGFLLIQQDLPNEVTCIYNYHI